MPFRASASRSRVQAPRPDDRSEPATILFFTGVRYERRVDDGSVMPPPPSDTPAGDARAGV